MPIVLSPRDLVSRPDNMDETVPHLLFHLIVGKLFSLQNLVLCPKMCCKYFEN